MSAFNRLELRGLQEVLSHNFLDVRFDIENGEILGQYVDGQTPVRVDVERRVIELRTESEDGHEFIWDVGVTADLFYAIEKYDVETEWVDQNGNPTEDPRFGYMDEETFLRVAEITEDQLTALIEGGSVERHPETGEIRAIESEPEWEI